MVTVSCIELVSVRVSEKTEWLFLRLVCSDGIIGLGEATMEGHEVGVKATIEALAAKMPGLPADSTEALADMRREAAGNAHAYTALSALEQAFLDAEGRRKSIPVYELLGGESKPCKLYANINRGIADRSPKGFAAAAREALDAGLTAIKIAPFDRLDCTGGFDGSQSNLYRAGLARIAAVRDAIGPDVALKVDCHWRFDPDTAKSLIADVARFGLYWLECPIAEVPETIPELRDLRRLCNEADMLLAGLESLNGLDAFAPFLERETMDVVMPDVKYAGGIAECQRIAAAALRRGINCSPHNPTGPICHAASLHLVSALDNCPVLEHQFRETLLFDELVGHAFPPLEHGCATPPPGPGLGVSLEGY